MKVKQISKEKIIMFRDLKCGCLFKRKDHNTTYIRCSDTSFNSVNLENGICTKLQPTDLVVKLKGVLKLR